MSEIKETITTSKENGVSDTGGQAQQQTTRVNTTASADAQSTASNFVWLVVGAVVVLLSFRFVLKLFGANPSSGFVDFVYMVTGVLTAPFDNIFGVTTVAADNVRSVFEPSILVAAAVYTIIGWGVVKLLNIDRSA